jgi:EAL domain-containing protein (putative c-di-GMP-specific phosphodiesterase class I)
MDDFGTGYSSLSYLQNYPINMIKIDRSFVQSIETNAGNRSIIKAIVDLANSLGMKTVAEGVETQEQLRHLVEIGCHKAQGYLFGKPMPLAQAIANYIEKDDGRSRDAA